MHTQVGVLQVFAAMNFSWERQETAASDDAQTRVESRRKKKKKTF